MATSAPESFTIRILTPMASVLNTEAVYLRAPATRGLLGVMAHHAPMVSHLAVGAAVVTEPSGEQRHFAVVDGILRVKHDEVVLLVRAAEEAEEIDVERAQMALDRATERLRAAAKDPVDLARAEMALARAANRLNVAVRAGL